MAGGKYDKLAGKTRPGTYINFESDRNDTVGNSERGIVLLPLIGYDFGPAKTPITLTAAAPDAYSVELGRSVYDATNDKMRLIREAFKKAAKVIVYITESGTAATGAAASLTVTAKYGGRCVRGRQDRRGADCSRSRRQAGEVRRYGRPESGIRREAGRRHERHQRKRRRHRVCGQDGGHQVQYSVLPRYRCYVADRSHHQNQVYAREHGQGRECGSAGRKEPRPRGRHQCHQLCCG